MPDADTFVAGVEPTILVEYVGNSYPGDTTERLDLAKDDNGKPRSLILNGSPLKLTTDEVGTISRSYQLKIVEQKSEPEPQVSQPLQQQAQSPLNVDETVKTLPGQSG